MIGTFNVDLNGLVTRVAIVGGAAIVLLTGSLQAQVQVRQPSGGLVASTAGPPPTGLGAEATPTSIKLRWTCPEGATGYEVYATPTGGSQIKLTPTPLSHLCLQASISTDPRLVTSTAYTSSFTHGGLAPAAEFTYVVRALYPTGFGDSGPLTAQTSLWPAPTGLVAIPSALNVDLQWNPVPGAAGYALTRESSSGVLKALTPNGCQTQTSYKDMGLVPGGYKYHVQSCPNSGSAVIAVQVGTVGYDMAVVGLDPTIRSYDYQTTWAVILRNEGDREVKQVSAECTIGSLTLRSLYGGPTYSPGLEAGFTVFTDKGVGSLYFDLGPGSHGGTCAVEIVQPSNVQDADPADNSRLVTFILPPANPPDLRLLAITREDCNGSFARQEKVGGDACIKLDYRFDNAKAPTLLKGEWTIECTVDGVTERAAGPSRLFIDFTNHTGIIKAMGFHGPGMGAAATRTVTCQLDPEGRIVEGDERNNVMTTTLSLP